MGMRAAPNTSLDLPGQQTLAEMWRGLSAELKILASPMSIML